MSGMTEAQAALLRKLRDDVAEKVAFYEAAAEVSEDAAKKWKFARKARDVFTRRKWKDRSAAFGVALTDMQEVAAGLAALAEYEARG